MSAEWTCPDCGRRFGRRGQGHECAPAMPLDEYLATGPPHEAPIVEAVLAALGDALGPDRVHVEPVSVGLFLKRGSLFAELRPMTRWEAVGFGLRRVERSGRIARKVVPAGQRHWHRVNVRTPAEVDEELVGWLVEAWEALGPPG